MFLFRGIFNFCWEIFNRCQFLKRENESELIGPFFVVFISAAKENKKWLNKEIEDSHGLYELQVKS